MFGFFIIILLVGIIVYQSRKIETLNAKIFRLQRELSKVKKSENIVEEKNVAEVQNVVKENVSAETPKEKKVKEKLDPAVTRNLSILITGSILIVLAAIVFLTTAWQSIPNFIKTIVLFLVAFVFLGASKLSREKYHLDKASKTFFYIGMAYLPICLLSISVFGLFGTYLSAGGEGKYIYLGASTLILAGLYYFISKKSKDRYLFYGSVLSQILSVILFTLMFEERIFLVFVNLLLYNLLLMLMTKDKIFDLALNCRLWRKVLYLSVRYTTSDYRFPKLPGQNQAFLLPFLSRTTHIDLLRHCYCRSLYLLFCFRLLNFVNFPLCFLPQAKEHHFFHFEICFLQIPEHCYCCF